MTGDPTASEEAQEILIRCGAVSYCADQLLRRGEQARQMLAETPLVKREALEMLIEAMIKPVENMLALTP